LTRTWPFEEAKYRLGEVVEEAIRNGPQMIARGGEEAVVVLSPSDYRRLTETRTDLVGFFQDSPLKGVELDLERNSEPPREVHL